MLAEKALWYNPFTEDVHVFPWKDVGAILKAQFFWKLFECTGCIFFYLWYKRLS